MPGLLGWVMMTHNLHTAGPMLANPNRRTTGAWLTRSTTAQKNDRSLSQIFRRRLYFAARYFEAKKRSKALRNSFPFSNAPLSIPG